ncbi:hypothetical protein [Legionella jordanis]|uniref:Uncharacterized protein n=1 Tax=Legionella jordanis TaxID=456 RepID=A0A0W0VD85_9GAMM|nr:hypothetical protein [Legionella jordanis]KTD18083.1 hypothetical protein Ljor_2389 [Legionella jordanis]RMX00601.1 hypothetical protein EAW55_12650 [Legionella jordanis]RMX21283.1 hypothetical protein EAS68_03675 [Legionella jordanis]VEH13825.1 Uncharacterised protein [Legionella jordanis]HAT8714206.1 hypothetical protein [Legionella jordanis]
MALFFMNNFAEKFDTQTKEFEKLKHILENGALLASQQEKAELATALTDAAKEMAHVVDKYRYCLMNTNSSLRKHQLLAEYEELFTALNGLANNRECNTQHFIKDLKNNNSTLVAYEVLERIANALAAVFWLGVATVALIGTAVFAASIVADPFGIAGTAICAGLLIFSLYKYVENITEIFEPKESYINNRERNCTTISFLELYGDSVKGCAVGM